MKKIPPAAKWLLLLFFAAFVIFLAFHFDETVRHWLLTHQSRFVRQIMRAVSHYGDWPEHVAAGLLVVLLAWWRGSKRWAHIGLTMLLACALAGVAARGVKIATGRARPSVHEIVAWHGPSLSSKHNSFPSGHTAATTGFFGVLLFVRRKIGLCLLPIPLLIAFSRMYVAAHFLSDVICAVLLGIFCAWLSVHWLLPSAIADRRSQIKD